jgi:pyruvate-formate lyase-activating enzyme
MSRLQCDSEILSRHYSCIKEPVLSPERMERFRKQFLCDDYPLSISLELGEYPCTHRCRMCPQSTVPFRGSGRFMDRATLETILDRIDPERPISLEISAYGETFLHPQATEFIRIARARLPKASITVATNGLLLNGETSEALVRAGIDCIQVSLNTGSAASYEWFCGRTEYEKVVSNLETLIEERNRWGSASKIITHIIEVEELKDEFLPFVQRWAGNADQIYIRGFGNWGGMVNSNGLHGMHPVPERRYPCVSLFCSLEVLSDGGAYKCFLHGVPGAEDSGCLGSLRDRTIEEIWKGPELRSYREMHLQGRFDEPPFCRQCRCWALFPDIWHGEQDRGGGIDA